MIRLTLISGPGAPRQAAFDRAPVTIGRAASNAFVIADNRISGFHGQIASRGDELVYADLNSRNGSIVELRGARTVVDGSRTPETALHDGARLLLGDIHDPVVVEVALQPGEATSMDTVLAARSPGDLATLSATWLGQRSERALLRRIVALTTSILEGEDAGAADPSTHLLRCVRGVASLVFDEMPSAEEVILIPPPLDDPDSTRPYSAVRDAGARRVPLADARLSRTVLLRLQSRGEALLYGESGSAAVGASLARLGVRSAIAVPVGGSAEGRGALLIQALSQRPLTEGDLDLATVLARQVGTPLLAALRLVRAQEEARALQAENRALRERAREAPRFPRLVGRSPVMQEVFEQMAAVAAVDTTVLVLGETGTGKELVARSIHEASPRRSRRFAAVNCGALADALLDSELFGHVRGAFTGATEDKRGLFEHADGGTLFLDEVGEVSPALQVKLLRVLQEGEVLPVGSSAPRKVDVRVVAATNRDLPVEVAAGRFRQDLYYRIHVFPIRLPPLRERGRDIDLLVEAFLRQLEGKLGRAIPGVSEGAMARLRAHPWPGNIRELQNELERAVILARNDEPLQESALSDRMRANVAPPSRVSDLRETMDRLEQQVVVRALEENDWNRTKTAKVLGISRQALQVKLQKWGLRPD